MRDRDAKRLDREIDRISRELPSGAGRFLRWLRGSSSRWVRVSVGLLLIIFGIFGFLPVLGFWMLPLGARHPLAPTANTAGARFVGTKIGRMEVSIQTVTGWPWRAPVG
jgi:hypothetical protein